MKPILDKYPDYSEQELSELVSIISQVLMDTGEGDEPIPDDLLQMAPHGTAREIVASLGGSSDIGNVQSAVSDPATSTELALHVIDAVRRVPALRDLVNERFEQGRQKMLTPELMLLTGALVVLALRVKRIKVRNIEISFYPAAEEVKAFLAGLLKSAP